MDSCQSADVNMLTYSTRDDSFKYQQALHTHFISLARYTFKWIMQFDMSM